MNGLPCVCVCVSQSIICFSLIFPFPVHIISACLEDLKTKKLLVQHVETVRSFEGMDNVMQSFMVSMLFFPSAYILFVLIDSVETAVIVLLFLKSLKWLLKIFLIGRSFLENCFGIDKLGGNIDHQCLYESIQISDDIEEENYIKGLLHINN